MNFNITFLIQMIAFAIFVFICMKYIWPPFIKSLSDREQMIAKSIEDAKKATKSLELANEQAQKIISDAKSQAQEIVDSALKDKNAIIEKANNLAKEEKSRILESAKAEISLEKNKAEESLRKELSSLVISSTEQILSKNISSEIDNKIIEDYLEKI